MAWDRVHLFWGDERVVPPDDPRSNFGTAKRAWIGNIPIPPSHVHAVSASAGATAGAVARAWESDLRVFFGGGDVPHLDLLLLGVGEDGHTAALFPGAEAVDETRRWAVPATAGTAPFVDRVTLTLPVLNGASRVFFLASGSKKAEILRRILREGSGELPAARVRPRGGATTWWIDRAAAALLEGPAG